MTKSSPLFLQPRVAQIGSFARCGHIGGSPRLAAGQDYPVRDGHPYQFLLQIDCTQMPVATWGGLMPRSGWISVFSSVSGLFDIRIVHSEEAEIEHQRPEAWDPKHSAFYYFNERYHKHFKAPVAWPLAIMQSGDKPSSPRGPRPIEEIFRISDEANWPLDWETHFLLVEEAIRSLEDKAQGYADAAKQRAATLQEPPARLLELLEELKLVALNLVEYWTKLSESTPFSPNEWRSRRSDLIRTRLLQDEWTLEKNQGLQSVISLVRIEKANNVGQLRSLRVPSPLFSLWKQPGRVHLQILKRAQKLVNALDNDPNVPKQDSARISPDYATFAAYRSKHPSEWLRYKKQILALRTDFYGYWLDNQDAVNKALGEWDQFPLPSSWKEAIHEVSRVAVWAEEEHLKISSGASNADVVFIQERNETARQASEAAGHLRAYRANPSIEASGVIYSAKKEFELFKRIDNCVDAGLLRDFWYVNYEVVRSEVGKRFYSCDPEQLSSPIRNHLERRWRFDAEQAIIQLGGKPLGESDTLAFSSEPMIMLFQIPSNNLTHFAHGDTGGLIVLISEGNLRDRRFDLASYDIGH